MVNTSLTLTASYEAVKSLGPNITIDNNFCVLAHQCHGVCAYQGAGCPYSPNRREGVFSETHIQPGAGLCNRTGAKPAFGTVRHRTLPPHVVVPNKDARITLYQRGRVFYASVPIHAT